MCVVVGGHFVTLEGEFLLIALFVLGITLSVYQMSPNVR